MLRGGRDIFDSHTYGTKNSLYLTVGDQRLHLRIRADYFLARIAGCDRAIAARAARDRPAERDAELEALSAAHRGNAKEPVEEFAR